MLVLMFAAGYFLVKDGRIRLTAWAARVPVVSFYEESAAREAAAGGTAEEDGGILQEVFERASGVHTISRFIEKQEENAVLAQAQPDPAYADDQKQKEEEQDAAKAAQTEETNAQEANGESAVQDAGDGTQPSQETAAESSSEAAGQTETAAAEPAMAATEVTGTVYTLEQLSDFEFLKSKFFYVHKSTTVYPEQLDAGTLLGRDLSLPESSEPQILLFHTHGSEAFADSEEGDPSMSITAVGDYLAQLLSEQYGIQVIHNTEVFPYSESYSLALDMINETLAQHPSIQVTIDLHRDAGARETVEINGKAMAPIMFFNGMCQTPEGPLEGVENPYLLDNLAFNFQMKLKAEAYYPGLTLRTFLKAYRYNQHVLPRATLVEVGTEQNTFEEARNSMEPLADILYKVLRGK